MNHANSFTSILVGSDGSAEAQHAVEMASTLAKCYGAQVTLVGVLSPLTAEQQAEGFGLEEHDKGQTRLEEQLGQSADAIRRNGLQVTVAVLTGKAEEQIERYVEEHAIDLVVVGHRDVSRVRHWLEHSTSESLLRRSTASVLVVHKNS